ncbi:TadE/TadG family type IV pilus assembly protein [Paenibacillus castaneae]|uniref:TadE/TadG family type IV pilus assembly protein n=1 Tax=Paenibacillus castaneae TaxID=474957 RepID=UPI001ABBC483|nr:TadE/TadG family type IV pilus assembly protein [Paenibacillus castaneae]
MRWLKKEQGSFTLESTLVFPLLLALILLFIIFGMYMYQKVILYYAASTTAERAAFSWDNSFRAPKSGMLSESQHDGLYWRMTEDEMLSSLFGLGGESQELTVSLPLESNNENNQLSLRKMKQAAQWLTHAGLVHEGQISYSRGLLKRSIEVKLKQPLSLGTLEQSWLKREPKTAAAASIVDPTEFIRSIDLVRYYSSKFAKKEGGAAQAKSQAGKALAPYQGDNSAHKQ